MILLAIVGAIGHGKSTLAEALVKTEPSAVHIETFEIIAKLVNKMKQTLPLDASISEINSWLEKMLPAISDYFGIEVELDNVRLPDSTDLSSAEFIKLKEYIEENARNSKFRNKLITTDNKEAHRAILQWFGGYFTSVIKPSIWADAAMALAYKAEKNGCSLFVIGGLRFPAQIKAIRAAGGIVIEVERPGIIEKDLADPTERDRHNIKTDIKVINNGTLKNLDEIAKQIIINLKLGVQQSVYSGM